jgi:hypothetical protein
MLTVKKFEKGATSTAAKSNKRGGQGHLRLEAKKVEVEGKEVFNITFRDFGNYGRERWKASFGELSPNQIDQVIDHLQSLRRGF